MSHETFLTVRTKIELWILRIWNRENSTIENYWTKITILQIGYVEGCYDCSEASNPTLPSIMNSPELYSPYHMAVLEIRICSDFALNNKEASLKSAGECDLEICHVVFTLIHSSLLLWSMLARRSVCLSSTGPSMHKSENRLFPVTTYKGNSLIKLRQGPNGIFCSSICVMRMKNDKHWS